MIIYADENVPEAETLFAPFGELRRFAGRSLAAADLRDADALVTGPEAEAFEKEFAELAGAADAVAVNSCSSALEKFLPRSKIRPGFSTR